MKKDLKTEGRFAKIVDEYLYFFCPFSRQCVRMRTENTHFLGG